MRLVLVILFITLIASCFQSTKSSKIINDVSIDTSFLVKVKPRFHPTSTMIVKITGEVSDSFIVMYSKIIPGGIVDTLIQTDFYSDEYLFKYNSYKARKGKLVISIEIP